MKMGIVDKQRLSAETITKSFLIAPFLETYGRENANPQNEL